jgi:hypothetical protein
MGHNILASNNLSRLITNNKMGITIRDLIKRINHGINKTSKILGITIINKEVRIINGLANNLINKTLGIGANQITNEYR